jgi:hypothetical protein
MGAMDIFNWLKDAGLWTLERWKEAAAQRSHNQWRRERERQNAPVSDERMRLSLEADRAQAGERERMEEDRDSLETGYQDSLESRQDTGYGLIQTKKIWDRAGMSHMADPGGDQLPKVTKSQARSMQKKWEGAQEADKDFLASKKRELDFRNIEWALSPEGEAYEQDRREGQALSQDLTNKLKEETLKRAQEGGRTSPADKNKRNELAMKRFTESMDRTEKMAMNITNQEMELETIGLEDQALSGDPEAIKRFRNIPFEKEDKFKRRFAATVHNALPGDTLLTLRKGEPLDAFHRSIVEEWLDTIKYRGIRRSHAEGTSLGAIIQMIEQGESEGLVGYKGLLY